MKILLLGHGVANDGCKALLDKDDIEHDYLEINEVNSFDYDVIIKSPGILLDDEIFTKFSGKVMTDIDLAYILRKPFIIGVTGTNGKTTISTILYTILSKKYKCVLCGNIGYSVCQALVDNPAKEIYIVELSSFQLEASSYLDCNISIISNISLAHIDHHKSLLSYVAAKLNICKNQSSSHYCVYNMDDPYLKNIKNYTNAYLYPFSYNNTINSVYQINDYIYYKNKRIYRIKKEEKNQKHIISNYLAIFTALSILKYDLKKASKIINNFKPVQYRFEKIDNNIYNDAKSTNCMSTEAALRSLSNVHLICGGYDRGNDIHLGYEALTKIRCVYAYGEAKDKIKNYFIDRGINAVDYIDLKSAFNDAIVNLNSYNNILYSPMCASFDQYNSYNERGLEFNNLYKSYKNNK